MGARRAALIGPGADVMYGMCPGRGTNDGEAVARSLVWAFTPCSFWLLTWLPGRSRFFPLSLSFSYRRLSGQNNDAAVQTKP